jgi:zinc D-Ala-D-Ala dipeptidase
MSHISHQRLRRLLILSALLFSLGWFANVYFICHMPEASLFTSPRSLSALCASAVKKEFPNRRDSIFKDHSYDAWHTAYAGAAPQSAAASEMPKEKGDFLEPDLAELVKLDSTIKLDIRYATSNNFLGRPVYKEGRAFLQRPAAEALTRANRRLREKGYGLLVFDGYRPWSVTKLFWDSTPQDKKRFVADPSQGSRHNRGCAVDLTLYDTRSGHEIEMPSVYDEMTERAYPNYSGGTEEQRRMRETLREAMESEGFTVYEFEWWHFDYKDWKRYPILDIGFDQIKKGRKD